MTTLNTKLRAKAEKELNENAERRDQDIEIFRRLVVSNKGQYLRNGLIRLKIVCNKGQ